MNSHFETSELLFWQKSAWSLTASLERFSSEVCEDCVEDGLLHVVFLNACYARLKLGEMKFMWFTSCSCVNEHRAALHSQTHMYLFHEITEFASLFGWIRSILKDHCTDIISHLWLSALYLALYECVTLFANAVMRIKDACQRSSEAVSLSEALLTDVSIWPASVWWVTLAQMMMLNCN